MDTTFTHAEEHRRGKGNRQTRTGPRVNTSVRPGHENGDQSPTDIAVSKLRKLLSGTNMDKKEMYKYLEIMKTGEQLRFMNMAVLSQVLVYLDSSGKKIIDFEIDEFKRTFNAVTIVPYIERLLNLKGGKSEENKAKLTENELNIQRLRMAATFIRYLKYVVELQRKQNEKEKLLPEYPPLSIFDEY